MADKTLCYLCKGCGLGEALDFEALPEGAFEDLDHEPAEVKTHDVLCSAEGVAAIKADLADGGYDSILIGACSARVKTDEFDFGDVVVERAALRELALWPTEAAYEGEEEEGEDRLMAAQDVLRMACVRLGKTKKPTPYQLPAEPAAGILVVGGGKAGMTAALEAAKAGAKVCLVEKEDALGGFMKKMKQVVGVTPP